MSPATQATQLFRRRERKAVRCTDSCSGANRNTSTMPCRISAGRSSIDPRASAIRDAVTASNPKCPARWSRPALSDGSGRNSVFSAMSQYKRWADDFAMFHEQALGELHRSLFRPASQGVQRSRRRCARRGSSIETRNPGSSGPSGSSVASWLSSRLSGMKWPLRVAMRARERLLRPVEMHERDRAAGRPQESGRDRSLQAPSS